MAESKEKVPTWDGSPVTWEDYVDRCRWYQGSVAWKDRHLVVSRLVRQLTGPAWKVISLLPTQKKRELAEDGDLEELFQILKNQLLRNAIPEASRRFYEYLHRFRRQRGESMKMYLPLPTRETRG